MTVRAHAGPLDRRVEVQSFTETRDAEGFPVQAWATVATVWASIHPLTGQEFFDAMTTLEETAARIRLRYDPDMNLEPGMRIVDGSDTWDIQSILNLETADTMYELMAVKRGD